MKRTVSEILKKSDIILPDSKGEVVRRTKLTNESIKGK